MTVKNPTTDEILRRGTFVRFESPYLPTAIIRDNNILPNPIRIFAVLIMYYSDGSSQEWLIAKEVYEKGIVKFNN